MTDLAVPTTTEAPTDDAPVGDVAPKRGAPIVSRYWAWALWAAVGLGIALRLRQWWFNRSIWGDEAAVALQFITRTYGGLTQPLGGQQGAPWGWLWMEKLCTQLFGISERAIRLVPLASGIVALVFAALLARRLLRPAPAVLCVLILAVVQPLVYYSTDIKQYQTDAAVTAVALYLTLVVLDKHTTWRWIAGWGVASALFVLCSQPAIFVVGVSAAVLGLRALQRRRLDTFGLLVAASIGWVAVFAAQYFRVLRIYHKDPALAAFWRAGYPPKGASLGGIVHWVPTVLSALAPTPLGLEWPWVLVALFIVGWVRLVVRQPDAAVFIGAVCVLALLAAAIRAFPLDGRLALYLDIPIVLTICAAGGPRRAATHDGRAAHRRAPSTTPDLVASAAACLVIVAVAISPIRAAAVAVKDPYVTVESRPAIQFILRNWQPGDRVWVEGQDAEPAIYYHKTIKGFGFWGTFDLDRSATCSSTPAIDAIRGPGTEDVWLLFGYPPKVADTPPGNTVANLEAKLERVGTIEKTFTAYGPVAAVLIDTKVPATATMPDTVVGCVTYTPTPTLHG